MTDSIPESPWSPAEKRFLLAELIKYGASDPQHLVNIIRNNNLDIARLDGVPLPPGRSYNSCIRMYNDMFPAQHNLSSHYTPPMQSQPPPHTPTPLSAPQQQYRPYHPGPTSATYAVSPAGRLIRPKTSTPVLSYGQSPSAPEPPPKRKRGRPTKAEAQAKADAAGLTGSDQPTPPRPAAQVTAAVLAPLQPARTMTPSTDEIRPMAAPATTRVSIAAILEPTTTPTTTMTSPAKPNSPPSHGSSSSSKRRKARQRQLMDTAETSAGAGADTLADLSSPMPAPRSRELTPTRSPAVSTPAREDPQSRPRSPPRPPAPLAASATPQSQPPPPPPPPPTAPARLPAPLQPRSPPPPGPSRP